MLGIDTSNGSFSYGSNITQAVGLVKPGVNTLTLTGANTYTGGTQINAGILDINGDTARRCRNAAELYRQRHLQAGANAIAVDSGARSPSTAASRPRLIRRALRCRSPVRSTAKAA